MNKKMLTIGVVALVVTLLAIGSVSGIPGKPAPADVQKRMDLNKNPAPFENVKAPLSGSALNIFEYRKAFTASVMGKKPAKRGTNSQPSPLAPTNMKFNLEVGALPQNEETIGVVPYGSSRMIVEGYNDYRGFWGLLSGASGYAVSANNGASMLREGALPDLSGTEDGTGEAYEAYSGGDPVIDTHNSDNAVYYASLFFNDSTLTSAIGLGKAMPGDLADTSQTDDQIWSVGQVAANDEFTQFNDKEWIAVDNSGGSFDGNVYVTWTAFNAGGAKIWMARCNAALSCTTLHGLGDEVSASQTSTQMSMVNVDKSGRVIVSWIEYTDSNPNPPYYRTKVWYRVYSAGGASALTPPILITTINKPASGYYASLGNEFRIPQNAWSEVGLTGSTPRMVIAYWACGGNYLYDIPLFKYADTCNNINTYMRTVDNYQTGSPTISPSMGVETGFQHSFFSTLSINPSANKIDIAWYQSEPTWKHDLYIYGQQRSFSTPGTVTQATSQWNYAGDPDSEDYFGIYGIFIGDYIQMITKSGSPNAKYFAYNANKNFASVKAYTDPFSGIVVKFGGFAQDNWLYKDTY